MAASTFGNSYAAQSAGLTAPVTGGQDIQLLLKNQLAEMAKKRTQRQAPAAPQLSMGSAAAFDLLGSVPSNGR